MNKVPYYVKNVYSLNNYLIFRDQEKLKLSMSSRTIKFKMYSNYDKLLDYNKIEYVSSGNVILNVSFNNDIIQDGYTLSIKKTGEIYIVASNDRGVRYALAVLNNLIEQRNGNIYLPLLKIDDEPSFKIRAIIEGFYGTPWSHENRLDAIKLMDKYRMNTFMYAPKDDEFHRDKWRELYPEEDFNKIIEYKTMCDSLNIDFYYCISPGKDFVYTNDDEFKTLFKKFDQVIDRGVKKFALLLDDIDYKLTDKNKEIFMRPGIAHSYICNKIYEYLRQNVIDMEMIMCPTEYHNNWNTQYINDLNTRLNDGISVFWTGDNVCAEVIDNNNAKVAAETFGNKVIIWDNHPVNDYLTSRLYFSPIMNRGNDLDRYCTGYVSNPMNQWHASKIAVVTMAHYMWNTNKYMPTISYDMALREVIDQKYYEAFKVFANANYSGVLSNYNRSKHKEWVENKDYNKIENYYNELVRSVNMVKEMNNELTKEIDPWLNRAIDEQKIFEMIKSNKIDKEEIIMLLSKPYVLGDEIIDFLLLDLNILTDEEYKENIKKNRGNYWWRVWEEK